MVGAVGQGRLVHDAQRLQALPDFGRQHRAAIVGESGIAQPQLFLDVCVMKVSSWGLIVGGAGGLASLARPQISS